MSENAVVLPNELTTGGLITPAIINALRELSAAANRINSIIDEVEPLPQLRVGNPVTIAGIL